MKVIPAINCKDWKCVKERFLIARNFLPKNGWVQIDISDGKFTKAKAYNDANRISQIAKRLSLKLEAHLMVKNPEKEIEKWLEAEADRIIFHIEAIKNNSLNFQFPISSFQLRKIGIAINLDTPIKEIITILENGINFRAGQRLFRISPRFIQLLAVKPGYSGRKFNSKILKNIRIIKKKCPGIKIEVDGGMDEKTAKVVKSAGADIIVAGSYIFDSKNPKESYKGIIALTR